MNRPEIECETCGEAFETCENWLFENETCPSCFSFPDVHPDEYTDEEYDVYLVARVQAPPKSGVQASYFRVAARSESEAMWFTEAYVVFDYIDSEERNRQRLKSLKIGEDGIANTNTRPELAASKSAGIDPHNGYAVRKLAFRSAHGDDERQEDRGPNTLDQITDPKQMDYKDVLIHATEEQIDHKLAENVPDDHCCYWTVSGTPRQTRHGKRGWFETDGRIVARGVIQSVENGRIWFSPLKRVDAEPPKDAPSRGFTYLDTEKRPEVLG